MIGGCYERNCRICYPLSWQQGDEPMRYWTVIFELTYGGGTVSIERVEAHNEAEAREEAVLEAFDDYDSRPSMTTTQSSRTTSGPRTYAPAT